MATLQELCEGGDWFERLLADGTYSEGHAADTVWTILKALQYSHSLGVVHRDIKPENLLYADRSDDAVIKLADFGLCAMMPDAALHPDMKSGMLEDIVGTPYYVAPEVRGSSGSWLALL